MENRVFNELDKDGCFQGDCKQGSATVGTQNRKASAGFPHSTLLCLKPCRQLDVITGPSRISSQLLLWGPPAQEEAFDSGLRHHPYFEGVPALKRPHCTQPTQLRTAPQHKQPRESLLLIVKVMDPELIENSSTRLNANWS